MNYNTKGIQVISKPRMKEVTNTVKGKLKLTKELVNKLHLTHFLVDKDIEWSGVLKYKILSGSIDDVENLVIEAYDFLLMDIDSATATEYDFNSDDTTLVDYLLDCQLNGFKYGHIHTHHSMGCYFSATDMGELHDNTPNHDLYLSLIVNKDYDVEKKWCAKLTYVTKKEVKGIKKTITNFSEKWSRIGVLGYLKQNEEVEEINEEEVNESIELLNMIDLDLIEEKTPQFVEDLKRFENISKKSNKFNHTKGNVFYPSQHLYPNLELFQEDDNFISVPKFKKQKGYQKKNSVTYSKKKNNSVNGEIKHLMKNTFSYTKVYNSLVSFIKMYFTEYKNIQVLSTIENMISIESEWDEIAEIIEEEFLDQYLEEQDLHTSSIAQYSIYQHLLGLRLKDVFTRVFKNPDFREYSITAIEDHFIDKSMFTLEENKELILL